VSVALHESETICAFRCGGVLYGLPAVSVCEVLEWRPITVVPLAITQVAGMIAYQGEVLTVIRLSSILDASMPSTNGAMLVLEHPATAERFALAIDSVEQVLSVPHLEVESNPPALALALQSPVHRILRGSGEPIVLLNTSSLTPDTLMQNLEPNSEASIEGELCGP
jgi:chemotaxis signal transduction protein